MVSSALSAGAVPHDHLTQLGVDVIDGHEAGVHGVVELAEPDALVVTSVTTLSAAGHHLGGELPLLRSVGAQGHHRGTRREHAREKQRRTGRRRGDYEVGPRTASATDDAAVTGASRTRPWSPRKRCGTFRSATRRAPPRTRAPGT